MGTFLNSIRAWLTPEMIRTLIKVGAIIIIGIPVVKLLANKLGKRAREKNSLQTEMLVKKGIVLLGFTIIIFTLLNEFGFRLSAILGALGIFGFAIGFASQTSVSNVISGLFLIMERPFEIGDVVQVGGTVGTVLSIDTLSVKLKTFDGRFVRIPNESIIKTETVNITRYPERRLDLDIGVAYKEDVTKVIEVLKDIAANNEFCLKEPEPAIFLNSFGDSALMIKMAMWHEKPNAINLRKTIMLTIKERFDAEGIEIPFPHISVYTGEATKPFPVSMKQEA